MIITKNTINVNGYSLATSLSDGVVTKSAVLDTNYNRSRSFEFNAVLLVNTEGETDLLDTHEDVQIDFDTSFVDTFLSKEGLPPVEGDYIEYLSSLGYNVYCQILER